MNDGKSAQGPTHPFLWENQKISDLTHGLGWEEEGAP